MFGPYFVVQFWFYHHLTGKRERWFLYLNCNTFLSYGCECSLSLPLGAVVVLQCVIVAFPVKITYL